MLASTMAVCATLVVAFGWHRSAPSGEASVTDATRPMPAASSLRSEERPLRFSDGSMAIPADDETRVAITDDTPSRMTAELARGRSRFEVVPCPSRMFAVRAGPVMVIVIGTVFTVERKEDIVSVSVERGRVRVESPAGDQELAAGESTTVRAAASPDGMGPPSSRSVPKPRAAPPPSR